MPPRATPYLLHHPAVCAKQDGVRLGDDATMLLLRHVVKLGCEPSAVGAMIGGASPMDPLFFMLHPLFEKGLHVLWMSPAFRDRYSFEWEDGSCTGSRLEDLMPFSGEYCCFVFVSLPSFTMFFIVMFFFFLTDCCYMCRSIIF